MLKQTKNMKVKLTLVKVLVPVKDMSTGESITGDFCEAPKVGKAFYIDDYDDEGTSWHTSTVKEIHDEHTFSTEFCTFHWELLSHDTHPNELNA